MDFGTRVRELRQMAYRRDPAVNIDSVSEYLDISRGQLMKIERGDKKPFDPERIRKFCDLINRQDLENELNKLALDSKQSMVFELENASVKQRETVLMLAREWDNPNSKIWTIFLDDGD